MSVQFQDYYESLGVSRDASQGEITKAYRKLARKYHPDVNKDGNAEDTFKKINEAYEVLGDAENRKRYNMLGANWKAGQDFTPPPGWEDLFSGFAGRTASGNGNRGFNVRFGNRAEGGFSDFFNSLFGASFDFGNGSATKANSAGSSTGNSPYGSGKGPRNGLDHRAEISISLEDAFHGASRTISLEVNEVGQQGIPLRKTKNYQVKIPSGITDGKTIRLSGQGGSATAGGPAGDLLLKIKFAKHPKFSAKGRKIHTTVKLSPWEAALGTKVRIPTLDSAVTLSVPPGSQSGQRLRLKGKGLPDKHGTRDDMFVEFQVAVPKHLSPEERELLEKLSTVSSFKPREEQ